jgi:hypothetical protein
MTGILGALSFCHSSWLSDDNTFLKNFVNQELLAVLGVIVTITLASAASLHLELNRLEDEYDEQFNEARAATKCYAYMLILLFFAALGLVVVKPILATAAVGQAISNSLAILIIVLNLMALADLTTAVFQIPARRRIGNHNTTGGAA